jgi:hypothetical protein
MGFMQYITVACHTSEEIGDDEIEFYFNDTIGGGDRYIGGVSIGEGETKHFTPDSSILVQGTDTLYVRESDLLIDDPIGLIVFGFDQSRFEFSSIPEWTSASYTFTVQLDGPTGLRDRSNG